MCQFIKSHHSEYIYALIIRVFFSGDPVFEKWRTWIRLTFLCRTMALYRRGTSSCRRSGSPARHVLSALPEDMVGQIMDLVEVAPAATPYSFLRARLLETHSLSNYEKWDMLQKTEQMGGSKPSKLLADMMELVSGAWGPPGAGGQSGQAVGCTCTRSNRVRRRRSFIIRGDRGQRRRLCRHQRRRQRLPRSWRPAARQRGRQEYHGAGREQCRSRRRCPEGPYSVCSRQVRQWSLLFPLELRRQGY
jgi:hypothetical protein